jgi:hypothetical protein
VHIDLGQREGSAGDPPITTALLPSCARPPSSCSTGEGIWQGGPDVS